MLSCYPFTFQNMNINNDMNYIPHTLNVALLLVEVSSRKSQNKTQNLESFIHLSVPIKCILHKIEIVRKELLFCKS